MDPAWLWLACRERTRNPMLHILVTANDNE